MKTALLTLLLSAPVWAQTSALTFYIDTSNGAQPISQLAAFPSNYEFPDTPVGASSSVVLRVVNSSGASVLVNGVGFVTGADSSQSVAFTSNLPIDFTMAAGAWKVFTVNFSPTTLGPVSAIMQVAVNFTQSNVSTLTGNGTAPQIALTCTNISAPISPPQCNGNTLQPNTLTAINYGNVLVTASAAIQFTLINNSPNALNPQTLVQLAIPTNNPSTPFTAPTLPATLAAGSSLNFVITFAPGSALTFQVGLKVGPNETFLLQGTGTSSTVGDLSSLVITFFDPTCKCSAGANPATPIPFGQVITGSTMSLTITVQNPTTTINSVTVASVQVMGAGFTVSGAPSGPVTIVPGQSISFTITFRASSVGTANGTLVLGTRQFPLQAQSIAPLITNATFTVDQEPLMSQQQVHLSITVDHAPTAALLGLLTLQFTPSVSGVTKDPAVAFVVPNSQMLQVSVDAGSQAVNYQGANAMTFQTGTTAGTIAFTLQLPSSQPFTKAFTIAPGKVQITGITAVRQSPNLVVTLTGYDNTYSAGGLSFTFSTAFGPMTVTADATSAFHQYFFTNDQTGGAFALQASFPVTGDVTQVSSVSATISNSSGQTSTSQPFQ
ncbi:MAG: choice-of-anchor D domain-containing protein [Acidobacteriaceae bacterium]|nr:choice-of-anchor D domain-containing protein [Acidobacteriaceae bacterium]